MSLNRTAPLTGLRIIGKTSANRLINHDVLNNSFVFGTQRSWDKYSASKMSGLNGPSNVTQGDPLSSSSSPQETTVNTGETNPIYLSVMILAALFSAMVSLFFLVIFKQCPKIRQKARFILLACITISQSIYFSTLAMISALGVFRWNIPYWACSLLRLVSNSSGGSELYSIAAMCIDRYVAVCRPLFYDSICCSENFYKAVLFIFTVPAVFPFLLFIFQCTMAGAEEVRVTLHSCSFDQLELFAWISAMRLTLFSLQFIACFFVISATYFLVVKEGMRAGVISPLNLRARRTITFHMFQLTLYALPVVIFVVYHSLNSEKKLSPTVGANMYTANTVVFTVAQAINPVIYGFRAADVKPFLPKILGGGNQVSSQNC
ncbi:odorant receptor 131-2-like [Protopterus annectens]|uniref:odorant receptor 131-2-like n=1 Tax=Protopterus annectens TaxID=7888 RepID=UPI001CFBD47F|nr:odorant receptor 131-2-like [Protopterus annectens]